MMANVMNIDKLILRRGLASSDDETKAKIEDKRRMRKGTTQRWLFISLASYANQIWIKINHKRRGKKRNEVQKFPERANVCLL